MVSARIEPIGTAGRERVIQATRDYVFKAEKIFKSNFPMITIRFDLMGKTAGMYKVRNAERGIRYNPYLFAKYFNENIGTTVPHEVAHYITDVVYGLNCIRPHGIEWKALMKEFGADASRTCNFDMEGIPQRIHRRFSYQCGCANHEITARRRNQIVKGLKRYFCRKCGSLLVPQVK
jgi:SprT protein